MALRAPLLGSSAWIWTLVCAVAGCHAQAGAGGQPPTSSHVAPILEGSRGKSAVSSPMVPLELGLMWPTFPQGIPPNKVEVELGRELFFDERLSSDDSVSCATCHDPVHGFADPRRVSAGVHGTKGKRNSPSIWNSAYFDELGWGGEHRSIEDQTLAAITNPDEMGVERDEVVGKLTPAQKGTLERLYGDASPEGVARALSAFQRTLIAGDSAFDRYVYAGDEAAVSDAAKEGFAVFLGEARCIQCHFMRSEASHPFGGYTGTFTDNRFHNIGVGYDDPTASEDLGRFAISKQAQDRGAFKTPGLRNVSLTAPYMHDGSLATLRDVVEHYNKGGNPNPNLDFDVKKLNLTETQKNNLVAFLESLTSVKLLKTASGQFSN